MTSFRDYFYFLLENKQTSLELLKKLFPNDHSLQQSIFQLDETPSKGDISTIVKLYFSANRDLNQLSSYLKKYYKLKRNNIKFQLPTDFISFTEKIDQLEYKQSQKLKPVDNSTVKITEGEDENKLAEDQYLIIYKAHSQRACVKYGEGYTFCISRSAGGNMYNNYRLSKDSTFYFIFFKNVPKSNPKHVLVLDKTSDGWEWTFADNATEKTTWNEVISTFPSLEKYEHLFVNKPKTPEENKK